MSTSIVTALPEVSPHLATSPILLKRILVAIDFSDQSSKGLEEAIAIARCFGSELLLVHAASPAVYGTGMEPIPIAPIELQLEIARAQMDELLAATPALKELKHREFVEYANAMEFIQEIAKQHSVDLIVAGSNSASGLERLLLGSVAESLLRAVSSPVLIVGPHSHKEPNPFHSILFATNLETTALRAAQFASSLAGHFHAHLTLLHVIEKKPSDTAAYPELVEERARMELSRLLPQSFNDQASAIVRVEYGKAASVVPNIAYSIGASLIVAGVSDRPPLGDHAPWSTLSHIIREATCPVLCVQRHLA